MALAIDPAKGASRGWFACGAMMGAAGVASAALSAHLPDRMLVAGGREALRAAVQMLGWHATGLLVASLWLRESALRPLVHLAALCLMAGTLCFCAGVCVPAFGGTHLGKLAPIGGSTSIAGWLLLAGSTLRRRR